MHKTKRMRRSGLSLLELTMVITIMGIVAAIGSARFGRSAFANIGAHGDAQKVSLSMLRTKREAIKTGDNHYLLFNAANPTPATQYSVMRRGAGGNTLVEGPFLFSQDVQVIASVSEMDFNFEGEAAGSYQVNFNGTGRNWQLTVVPVTGAVIVTDVTP
ncbi:MAG TPA: type II secretion system protein [Pirellulaceae bacterium]|nr:type II secretion system protein [Planctomycetales bacterium]MCB9937223.1 type II secretion system protein [Planctomycetaceae bacterium]HRX79808.1 type II secretion system protein [Pirellulaceae bacterium]